MDMEQLITTVQLCSLKLLIYSGSEVGDYTNSWYTTNDARPLKLQAFNKKLV